MYFFGDWSKSFQVAEGVLFAGKRSGSTGPRRTVKVTNIPGFKDYHPRLRPGQSGQRVRHGYAHPRSQRRAGQDLQDRALKPVNRGRLARVHAVTAGTRTRRAVSRPISEQPDRNTMENSAVRIAGMLFVILLVGLPVRAEDTLCRTQPDASASPPAGRQRAATPAPFPKELLGNPEYIELGKEVFDKICKFCHGKTAYPGKAPKLNPVALYAGVRVRPGHQRLSRHGELQGAVLRQGASGRHGVHHEQGVLELEIFLRGARRTHTARRPSRRAMHGRME